SDAAGDLFGTTGSGGANSDGEVYEIAKTANGYSSTPTVLASFNGTNGLNAKGGLIMDAAGDLYGTTFSGGPSSVGTVFEIVKTGTGYSSTPVVLYTFNGTNGQNPGWGLFMDASGNLFATTQAGPSNNGMVLEIKTASS